MSDTHAHVKPEPIEAPQPQPKLARGRDLIEHRARVKAWQAAAYCGDPSCLSYGTACLIIETYLASVEAQKRGAGR